MNKHDFEQARKLYPGRKRGFGQEWENFRKKYGMKMTAICPLLKPAIEAQIAYRATTKDWCPQWKHFATWINGGWWTEEVPQTDKPKTMKCGKCGKPTTHSIFVYFEDGARNVYRCDACPDPEPDWKKRQAQAG